MFKFGALMRKFQRDPFCFVYRKTNNTYTDLWQTAGTPMWASTYLRGAWVVLVCHLGKKEVFSFTILMENIKK